jgi:hypothetical protein
VIEVMKILGRNISLDDVESHVGSFSQLFGVDLVTHENGLQRGNRVLIFRTGSGLIFEVQVDRAMDLSGMNYLGVPIGWESPAGLRSPSLHEFNAEDGFSWARSFSGLMNSCGLDHIHAPETDNAAHFNHPPRPEITFSLHSRIAYTPALLTGYGVRWGRERAFLYATGEVRQATVFGENFVLERRIEVEVGTSRVVYADTVRNLSYNTVPHAYLWHINLGWPLLSAGARMISPVAETSWSLREEESGEKGAFEQTGPRHPTTQQVYDHHVRLDADGTARAALIHDDFAHPAGARGLALEIAYDGRAMPALFQWQFFQSGNYVTAIEPSTTHAGSRADWHARKEFKLLSHNDSASYRLELTPHIGATAIAEAESRIMSPVTR